jgi:hypothetical protein
VHQAPRDPAHHRPQPAALAAQRSEPFVESVKTFGL